jgi:methylated-DNA-protein-cysteine methyltransferase related protein
MKGGVFADVQRLVARIPRGRVMTYGRLSRLVEGRLTPVGVGWAIRAGGDAIPWHRVVNAKGGVSTDGEHPGLQRALLEAEGVVFDREGRIDLSQYEHVPRGRR